MGSSTLSRPIYHHHHVILLAQISMNLFPQSYVSSIASGRSSRLYTVSELSCKKVLVGRLTLARQCKGVH